MSTAYHHPVAEITRALIRATVVAVVLIIGFSGVLAPAAAARPVDDPLPSDSPTLSLSSMGLDGILGLYGLQGAQALTIPIPPGLTPSALNALVELPVGVHGGTIAVSQGDRTLARVPLPTDFRQPVSIPLAGADVEDNAVAVLVRSYLDPLEGYCLYDPTVPLRLADASVAFTGAELPPATVADFLPPVLRKLTLFVPATPSRAESDAAIRLAAAVVAHYGKQNTAVTVTPLQDGQTAPPGPSLPLQRQIVVREGPHSGLALQGGAGVPSLLISGPADELINQTRALSGDIGKLALSSKAVAGPLRSAPQLSADVTTLRRLGQPGVNATALSPQVSIALDQTRLGRPSHDVRVQLRGSYTPLPSSVGGQLVAAIGGETIDRWPAASDGIIDRWVNVPDRILQRYTNLGVAINITGDTGRCGEFQPITLTIDGDSPIQSSLAKPPVPGGFQALPQALIPRVQIGIGATFDDTQRALTILVGLQRLSALPIDTAVTTLDAAIASPLPAILVNAAGWTDNRITLPVAPGPDGGITVEDADATGQHGNLTLDPALRFGSLQTTYDGNRTVLIATSNNAPDQLDDLLGWLDSNVERWSRLTGNALIGAQGHAPVVVGTAARQPPAVVAPEDRSTLWWAIGGAITALAAVAAALITLRRRRSQS